MTGPFNQQTPEARKLTELLKDHDRRLRMLEGSASRPQLGHSSLDNSAIIAKDTLEQVRLKIGAQTDGTFAVKYVAGDPPPQPNPPVVSARQLSIAVGWDGGFVGTAEPPEDLQRVDVHVSNTDGFTPDSSTAYMSLLGPGVVTIPADFEQQYVKLIAVSHSQAASEPSAQRDVHPLPADAIGAGAIGAEQLAALIVLATRLVAGDPSLARVELNELGIQAYNTAGEQTVNIDTNGNALLVGEYRTALSGLRITIGEQGDHQVIRFYREGDDTHYSEVVGFTDDEGRSAVWMRGSSSRADQGGSIFITNEDESVIQWFTPDTLYSRLRASRIATQIQSGFVDLTADRRRRDEAGPLGARVAFTTLGFSEGELITNSILHYHIWSETDSGNPDAHNQPRLTSTPHNASIIWSSDGAGNDGHIYITNNDPNSPLPIEVRASNTTWTSSREVKTDICEVGFDVLDAVKRARCHGYRYTHEQSGPMRYGPMAEDMPPHVVRDVPNMPGGKAIDHFSVIGLLWDAVGKLADRVEQLEDKLAPKGETT